MEPLSLDNELSDPMSGVRRLNAVMHADVAGYSRLIGLDDIGTVHRLRTLRRELIDPVLREFHGRIVNTAGDSMMIVFDSIDAAMQCALRVQQQMPIYDGDQPPALGIRFRVGIDIADLIDDRTDVHGDGVNIAARLQSACPVGGICVSRAVRDHVRARLSLDFEPLGLLTLKNIVRPVEAFVLRLDPSAQPLAPVARRRSRLAKLTGLAALVFVCGVGGSYWLHRDRILPDAQTLLAPVRTGSAVPPRLSIVVLPFTNLSNDREQDYFADAITDDLTTDLSRISGSVVIAHSTAQTYRDRPLDVRRIGHDLDVRYLLEGSVRRVSEQVEINAQLIDTESGTHVWADRFVADRRDLAEEQSEITGRLARTLHLELLEAEGHRIEQEKNADPDARDLVMRGWVMWFRPFSIATHQEAELAFEKALALDPKSVDAKIGVATILISNIGTGLSQSQQQDSGRAEQLLLEAIEQDANSSRAHEALGALRRIQNRLTEARIEYETAVALDRNNAHALLGLGQTLMFLGHPADAIPAIESSVRLDPRDPNAAFADWALGTCYLLLGHVDKATDLLRKATAENPRVYYFQIYLAGALGLHGDIEEARAAVTAAIRLNPRVSSLERWSATQPWINTPAFVELRGNTVDVGLRHAGMPDH